MSEDVAEREVNEIFPSQFGFVGRVQSFRPYLGRTSLRSVIFERHTAKGQKEKNPVARLRVFKNVRARRRPITNGVGVVQALAISGDCSRKCEHRNC